MNDELKRAIGVLADAGAVFVVPGMPSAMSVGSVAVAIELKPDWVRGHLDEFPNWFRLPGGGQNGGEIRIPLRDLEKFMERRRGARPPAKAA